MLSLTLAWRNLWRNRRRTFITMASIIMAVILSSIMNSMQLGQYDQMIDNSVGKFSGHIQVQDTSYLDEPTLDHSIEWSTEIEERLSATSGVEHVIPRIDTYALAAGPERSRAAMLIGIDPEVEAQLSDPQSKLIKGTYFSNTFENGVLIAEGLADFLNVNTGDTLILIGSGYQGMSASGAYPILGILRFGIPEMNKSMVYIPLETIQEMTGAYDRVTAIAILVDRISDIGSISSDIDKTLPEGLVARPWQDIMPELVQAIQADYGSSFIILLILYMVVGFGIFGTVLMMTAERTYELGVMTAIGTPKSRLAGILTLEMICITVMSTIIGIVVSFPIMYYFNVNPLEFDGETAKAILEYGMEPYIRFSLDPMVPMTQAGIVLAITAAISLYPLWHMRNLKPVEAMRH